MKLQALKRCMILALLIMISMVVLSVKVSAVLKINTPIPLFELKDIRGDAYHLDHVQKKELFILYFFDAGSPSSQDGLIAIDALAKEYKDAGLNVWAITRSNKTEVQSFVDRHHPFFPILLDDNNVSKLYDARLILPTVCIIGPKLRLMDYIQGGGKGTEKMLILLAERMLQRKQTGVAKAISNTVKKKNPENIDARVVEGYADLKAGRYNEAEAVFMSLSKMKGMAKVLGEEGLALLYSHKGDTQKAMGYANRVKGYGKSRALVHVVMGGIHYSQGNIAMAEAEYKRGATMKGAKPEHTALAYNQLGRILAQKGDFEDSRSKYDTAIDIDPYLIEATSNKGVTFEKEGNWAKAFETFQKVQVRQQNDMFSAVLAKKAQNMLNIQKDTERNNRIDQLVKTLADRYRKQKRTMQKKVSDSWTSRPMILSFVNIAESGGLPVRDGFSSVLTTRLSDQLNQSLRVKVVERVVMDRLFEELNIGSSELSDPSTALKLGKLLSAKILATGSLFHLSSGSLLSLRLVDTETSHIAKVFNLQFQSEKTIRDTLYQLNREILATVIQNYPLQAFVVNTKGKKVMINLGSDQGVVRGARFNVIEEKEPIEYKGKKLNQEPLVVGSIEITGIEKDFSHGMIKDQKRSIKRDDKVIENMDHILEYIQSLSKR